MNIKESFLEVFMSVIPVILIVTIINFTVAGLPPEVFIKFLLGALFILAGLTLFLAGVSVSFLPLGEMIGSSIAEKARAWLLLVTGFLVGFVATVAEPDLQVLASQISDVSGGSIGKASLVLFVSIGTGIFIMIAILRILLNIPLLYILAGGYLLVFVLAFVSPSHFSPVAFDSGAVTTGPMTVPFILALGVGVNSVVRRRGSSGDSFGLVALGSLGPILAVFLMGVFI
ncbi:MAG: DUF1538 domain-containing protein [Eubacteriales bacterium]|nr:DUF1538 domain-containing protein [Eubacteriales bacterium]